MIQMAVLCIVTLLNFHDYSTADVTQDDLEVALLLRLP
jgi:hypothetical protein